jgi:hypothetical protein
MTKPPLNMSGPCSLRRRQMAPIILTWQLSSNGMPDFCRKPNDLRKRPISSYEPMPSSPIPLPPLPIDRLLPGNIPQHSIFGPVALEKLTYLGVHLVVLRKIFGLFPGISTFMFGIRIVS